MGESRPDPPSGDEAALPPRTGEDVVEEDEDRFDIEAALLALSEDLSGPTVDMDVSALSPTERRMVIRMLRERLGLRLPPGEAP